MNQIELIWEFQQADMETDQFESRIRRNPKRITLKRNRDFLMEQQKVVKQMDEDVAEMKDRMDVIQLAISRIVEQQNSLSKKMEEKPAENAKEANSFFKEATKLEKNAVDYQKELERIIKDVKEKDQKEREIRQKYSKVKSEYDKLKVEYEVEHKKEMIDLEERRKSVDEKAKGIDSELISQYRSIKQHVTPPVAMLIGDQCGGCNMNLPQVIIRKMKTSGKLIECETCGRLLIPKE